MNLIQRIRAAFAEIHTPRLTGLEILKYIGPGLLVTVGFIDPGNWAANVSAGATYGYTLLWMVTLSTIMLMILQHNAAHLGIATGLCISEAATQHCKPWASRSILGSAVVAAVCTALAEILGGAIALNMLFHIPLKIGAVITVSVTLWLLLSNSYRKVERIIIAFVSLIGISFMVEMMLVPVDWKAAAIGWVTPAFPSGSIPIIMSVLGAVVMPHNLFLHSEIIQSRQWNVEDEKIIRHQLKYEFLDTTLSMIIGWGINSAMIIVAAAVFFTQKIPVTELQQAQSMLEPMIGSAAALIFAIALLFSGISSSVTAGMAGGSIFAGIFKEAYDIKDRHSRTGVLLTLLGATLAIFFIPNPFQGLIYSQVALSIQLPWTVFLLIYLTSSRKVMGKYANHAYTNISLWLVALTVTVLNILLLVDTLKSL